MGCAGTESFLSGLFRTRITHFKDPHISVKNYDERTKDYKTSDKESLNVVHCGVKAGQFDNRVIVTVNFVNDVPTQL